VLSERVPADSQIFEDSGEILSSMAVTTSYGLILCSLKLTSLAHGIEEKHYQTGHFCKYDMYVDGEYHFGNLDSDPPIELTSSRAVLINGFSTKHDQGNVRRFGWNDPIEDWKVLGGPIIGLHFNGTVTLNIGQDLSLIIGDKCMPKYFGARILSLRLGETKQV